jgi:hypothetical protein
VTDTVTGAPGSNKNLATLIQRSRESRYIPLYDSNNIANAAVGLAAQFFNNVAGKNIVQSNMPANGVLPAPRQFLVEQLCMVLPVDCNTADAEALIGQSVIQWFISDKQYLQAPLFAVPGGVGISGFGATGVAATTVDVATNGFPSPAARFSLHRPGQLIRTQENFRVDMTIPTAITLTATRRVWCVLWGTELRAVQ